MPTSIAKFAPQAMVLVVALYWSWPTLKVTFLQPSRAIAKMDAPKPAGMKDFAAAVLSPKFVPFPKQNPFLTAESKKKKAAVAQSGKPGKKMDAKAKVAALRDAGLVLTGTCIMGKQRMAVINGKVYREKETIPQPGDEAGVCIVTSILPHKVLLSYQGETLQLGYVDIALKAAGNNRGKPTK
jgi:hypothetical protein